MKRVAAGAHLPIPWLFEPAKRPDDRADYYLGCLLPIARKIKLLSPLSAIGGGVDGLLGAETLDPSSLVLGDGTDWEGRGKLKLSPSCSASSDWSSRWT